MFVSALLMMKFFFLNEPPYEKTNNLHAKTKTQISFIVTAQLICVFVFVYADCVFSAAAAHTFIKKLE